MAKELTVINKEAVTFMLQALLLLGSLFLYTLRKDPTHEPYPLISK